MAANVTDAEFHAILHWVEDRTGLRFRDDQIEATIAVVTRVMNKLQIEHPSHLKRALNEHPETLEQLINELTVGETYFFREARHFECIREMILPDITQRRGADRTIRIWSAGCASGEEAYSLAIVCREVGISDRVDILATDLSAAALQKARQAVYRQWSFRGDAMAVVERYVTCHGEVFHLDDSIKRMVKFRMLNLAANDYPSPASGTCDVDLILCRNVLIYFGAKTIREIARRLYECLAVGGWLLTASGDPPLNELANFACVTTKYGVFYRKLAAPLDSIRKTPQVQHDSAVSTHRGDPSPAKESLPGSKQLGLPTPRGVPKYGIGSVANDKGAGPPRRVVGAVANSTAIAALKSGNYRLAMELTEDSPDDLTACLVNIKATVALDPAAAMEKCKLAVQRHALAEEVHYLYGVLLEDAHRSLEALQSVQKSLFLNRSSVMGHFLFGSIQLQRGQLESARRHFRNVCELCASRRPTEVLPLSNGESVADVAVAAESQLARIDAILK